LSLRSALLARTPTVDKSSFEEWFCSVIICPFHKAQLPFVTPSTSSGQVLSAVPVVTLSAAEGSINIAYPNIQAGLKNK
jgi:hypothetical protein